MAPGLGFLVARRSAHQLEPHSSSPRPGSHRVKPFTRFDTLRTPRPVTNAKAELDSAFFALAPGLGFEPRYNAPEALVLPLDDPGT